ncbi:hypothetical protein L202_05182 [Cryptococcus amylolentus CBS 6039]|uniref:Uncharacterized protein n=2 Tax=Cryptococcus amylolentus TaxID=104669 RepID=A0A1E3HK63_9TREE|nr:hypothetical protein L202_05182 [Cryptococcus amylolentus CBS 6039]ODN76515.1 hypothetical protein L202_05182 [Cryptococcus amylolentus CBS 6039]ODO04507.1 hypothetical protein I350_05111 [Cryptococcus amylolentus CBS 6273]
MADPVDSAVQCKRSHPKESFAKVAKRFKVVSSTLNNRYHKRHASHATNNPRKLPVIKENQLVDKIKTFADRGMLLAPAKVIEGDSPGAIGGSPSVERHPVELDSGPQETYDSDDLSNPPSQASQPPPPAPETPLGPRRRGRGTLRDWELDQIVALAQTEAEAEVVKAETVRLEKELEEVRAARAAMAPEQDTGGARKALEDLGGGLYDLKYRDENREALKKRKEREQKEEKNRGGRVKRARRS